MRYYDQTKTYNQLREMSDRICEEHGLSVIRTPEHSSLSYADWQKENDEVSCTKKHLYEDLDAVLEYVTSFEQFKREIQNRGYVLEYRGSFLRIRADEGKKFYRLDRLGEGYTVEDIRDRCRQNYYDNSRKEYDYYSLPRRDKSKGIAGLYGYYVYLLKIIKDKIADSEKRLKELIYEEEDKKRLSDGIIPAYRRFRSWALEFDQSSFERKKMIICELFNRIEIGRDYTVNCELNFTYKQFCTEWATVEEKITATA